MACRDAPRSPHTAVAAWAGAGSGSAAPSASRRGRARSGRRRWGGAGRGPPPTRWFRPGHASSRDLRSATGQQGLATVVEANDAQSPTQQRDQLGSLHRRPSCEVFTNLIGRRRLAGPCGIKAAITLVFTACLLVTGALTAGAATLDMRGSWALDVTGGNNPAVPML